MNNVIPFTPKAAVLPLIADDGLAEAKAAYSVDMTQTATAGLVMNVIPFTPRAALLPIDNDGLAEAGAPYSASIVQNEVGGLALVEAYVPPAFVAEFRQRCAAYRVDIIQTVKAGLVLFDACVPLALAMELLNLLSAANEPVPA